MQYLAKMVIVMRKRTMKSKTNNPRSEHPGPVKLKQRFSFKALQNQELLDDNELSFIFYFLTYTVNLSFFTKLQSRRVQIASRNSPVQSSPQQSKQSH